jgi:hypothetical protein
LVEFAVREHRIQLGPHAAIADAHSRERDESLDCDRGSQGSREQNREHENTAPREEFYD